MEEFLSIVFLIGLVIWGILNGIAWIFIKVGEALSLTFTFISTDLEAHIFASIFILFISFLYVSNDGEKKKNSNNERKEKQIPSRKSIPIKYTKEYYGVNNNMSKIEIKKILNSEYMKYSRQQTSQSGRIISEAEEHKRAITRLQTELLGKL